MHAQNFGSDLFVLVMSRDLKDINGDLLETQWRPVGVHGVVLAMSDWSPSPPGRHAKYIGEMGP